MSEIQNNVSGDELLKSLGYELIGENEYCKTEVMKSMVYKTTINFINKDNIDIVTVAERQSYGFTHYLGMSTVLTPLLLQAITAKNKEMRS